MKDYGIQRSTVQPQDVEIAETKVFVSTDIKEVTVKDEMEEQEHIEYEFRLVEYDKNEYIKMISEKNSELETEVTNTQIALCEVYELLG